MLKEWPLVAFTILGQMAVGVFLLTCFFLSVSWGTPFVDSRGTLLLDFALVLGSLVAAALISFFHLRHPIRARRVLSNLRTSWLSREILFELGFMGLVALTGLQAWRGAERGGAFTGLLLAGCAAGALFLASMSKLYMLPTLPAWNTVLTPLSFGLTTLILGAMGLALILRLGGGPWHAPKLLLRSALMALAIETVMVHYHLSRDGVRASRPIPSLRPPDTPPRFLRGARQVTLTIGFALVVAVMATNDDRILPPAFALILAGEVAGRFLFYGLVTRPGR
mgnify:CR=1 FL=1